MSDSDRGWLGFLRTASLLAVAVGAVGSFGLMLRAGQRTPRLLLIPFTIWILSPFVALAWANVASNRWSLVTRAALYCVTLVLTLGALAIYGNLVVVAPPGSPDAFVFVVVAPASWLLLAIVVPVAALISRWLSHRAAGA